MVDNKGIGNTSVQFDSVQNTMSAGLSSTQRPATPIVQPQLQSTPIVGPSTEQPVAMVSFHPDSYQPDSGIPAPARQAAPSSPLQSSSFQPEVHSEPTQAAAPALKPLFTSNATPPISPAPVAARPEMVQAMRPIAPPMPVFSRGEAQPPKPPHVRRPLPGFAKRAGLGLLALFLIGGGAWFLIVANRNSQTNSTIANNQVDPASRFDTLQVPLNELANLGSLVIDGSRTLSINGQLRANNSLVISPTTRPTDPVAGQMYYDVASNVLAYYNGTAFVDLLGNQSGVTNIGGQTGNVTLGNGLGAANGSITNTGVLSVQGQTGAVSLTGGNGIAVDGTTLSNTGVLSIGSQTGAIALGAGLTVNNGTLSNTGVLNIVAGTPNLTVTNDGAGTVTISSTNGSGSGTVSSPGGTPGHIAKFTGVQTIADSLLSESGTTVTVGGGLTVTGAFSLTTPLAVTSGGTGVATLTNNGVVIGQGTGPLTTVNASGAGQCLVSTAGAPTFQACPGSGGVTSLNGLNGVLTLANSTGAGSTITINDASTLQKGIAQFNSTNFSTTGGVVNTAQDINVTASPTFASLTLTSPLTLTNGGTGATTAPGARTNLGAAASGPNSDITSLSGLTTALSVGQGGTGANSAPTARTNLGAAASGSNGDITATAALNTITPTSTLVLGATSQSFILQGNTSSTLTATNGVNTTTIGFANPSANVTINFPALVAGTYSVCTTSGNCAGSGGGVTSPGGTAGVIPKFTGSQTLADSIISDNGSTVTIAGAGVIQGTAGLTIGTPSTTTGKIVLANSTNANTLTLQSGATAASLTFTLPTADGSNNQCLTTNGAGVLSFQTCLTGSGSGSGVISLDTLSGSLVLANSTGAGSTVTINDASTTQKGIAQFNGTNFSASGGVINTTQDINVTASPTFASLTLTTPLSVPNGGTGGTNFTTNGILYGNGTSALQITGAAANSILATNVSSVPSLTQTLPTAVQGNITTLGVVTAGSLGAGFGAINTGSTITTSATVQGGIVNGTSALQLGGVNINTAGTLTNVAYLNATQAFSGSNTFTRSGSGTGDSTLAVTGAPVGDATSSLIRIANAIAAGNSVANGGTYIGLNAPASGAGSTADFLNFEQNGTSTFKVTGAGAVTANSMNTTNGYSVGGTSIITSGLAIQNATGITSSGTITFSGLNAVGVVQTNGSGVLSTSNLNLQTGPVTGVLPVANGGTGANNPSNARMNLSAAQSGANADITSTSVLNTITPTNTLTIGATSQAFILQGNKLSTLTATDGVNTTTIGFTDPTATTTFNFPALAAGTYGICTTGGNCASSGGGVTTSGGTAGKIAMFSGSQAIVDSIISQSGSAITIAGSGIIQGASGLTLGVGSSTTGKVVFQNATNNNTFTLQSGVAGSNLSFTLPTADGSNNQCLSTNGAGVLAFETCLTGSGSTGGVSSLNGLVGVLTLANAVGAGSTVTINDASTTQKGIAQFNSTNFSTSGGTVNTIQDIAPSSTPSFAALNVTGTNGITVGTSTTLGTIVLKDGNAATFGVTIQVAPPLTANQTLIIPDATGIICLQSSASCGFAASTGSTAYIQNGTAVQASANFNIQSTGNATTTAVLTARASQTADLLQFQNSTGGTVYGGVNATGAIYSNGTFNENTTNGGSYLGSAGGTPRLMLANGVAAQSWEVDNNGGTLRMFRPGVIPALAIQSSGAITFQNSTNSTTGFQVQNSSGSNLLTIDTTGNKTTLGTIAASGSVVAGTLAFADGTTDNFGATLNTTTLTANRTITMPDATGTICLQASASCGFATSTGSGNYIQNQIASQQAGANYWISNTGRADTSLLTPSLDSATAVALSIGTTNATSINLNQNTTLAGGKSFTFASGAGNFDQSASSGNFSTGTGTVALNGNTAIATNKSLTANGSALFKDATNATNAFQVQNTSGVNLLTIDTTGNKTTLGTIAGSGTVAAGTLLFADGTTDNFGATLNTTTLTANRTITMPDATGTICLQASASCGFALSTGSGNYIQNQIASQQAAANYWIGGTGRADTSLLTPLLDAASAVALNIGTTNATSINLNQNTILAAGKNLTFASGTGNFDQSASSGSFSTGSGIVHLNGTTTVATNKSFTANGSALFANATNSATAFQIQNNAGLNLLTVDTTGNKTTLGTIAGSGTVAAGTLLFADGTTDNFGATLNTTTLTANRTITMPDATGTICLQASASCGFALSTGSGNYIQNQIASQQAGANYWISNTGRADTSLLTPLLDSATAVALNVGTTNATSINLNQNTVLAAGKNLTFASGAGNFDQSASTGSFATGTGTVALNANTTVATNKSLTANGLALFKDATNATNAFQVQNTSGVNLLTIDTTGNKTTLGTIAGSGTVAAGTLLFADGTIDNFGATLNTTTLTANRTITMPDATGTICLQNSASCGFATSTGSGNYIQNQIASQQAAANYWISGTGRADTSVLTPLLDSATAVALSIGTTNATSINLNQNTTLAAGKNLTFTSGAGNFDQSASTGNFATGTGTVALNGNATVATNKSLTANGLALFKDATNSATAFQIQNNAGLNLLTVDTTGNKTTLGTIAGSGTVAAGTLLFADGTTDNFGATLNTTTLTASRTITMPNATGTICLQSSASCGFATSTGSAGYIQNQIASQQAAANYWISGTGRADTSILTPLLDTASATALALGTTNATGINLNQTTTLAAGKNLTFTAGAGNFDQSASTGTFATGTGTASLNGNTTVATNKSFTANGSALFANATNSATAFQIQNNAGLNLLTVDTTGNKTTLGTIAGSGTVAAGTLLFADGTTDNFGATLNTTTLTASRTITMPNATGTICLQSSASCGFAASTGSTGYIQNQIASQQAAANYWISGTGRADTSLLTPLLDSATASALNIGTTNATSINLNQNTIVATNKSLTANGLALFKDATNATNAFQVQNSTGANLLTVDSTNTALVLGNDGTPTALTVRGGAATGTDAVGSNITFDASNGTGAGGSGDFIFRTAGVGTTGSVAQDAVSTAHVSGGTTSLTWSHTVGAGSNRLLVIGLTTSAAAPLTVTFGGVSLTRLSTVTNGGGSAHSEIWYLKNPTSGAGTVSITFSASTAVGAGSASYTNVNQTTPFGTVATNTGNGTVATNPLSGTNSSQLVFDSFSFAAIASSWTTTKTLLWSSSTFNGVAASSQTANNGSTSVVWSNSGTAEQWADAAAPINPVSTGSGTNTLTDRLHIAANGNIGIGIASPQDTLSIATGNIYLGNGSGSKINMTGSPTSDTFYNFYGSSTESVLNAPASNGDIAFKLQNAELARFASNGDFGIGTTTPGYAIDVENGGQISVGSGGYFSNNDGTANRTKILLNGPGDWLGLQAEGSQVYSFADKNANTNTTGTAVMSFLLNGTGGSVGVNTSAPNQPLTVNGNSAIWNANKEIFYDDSGVTQRGYLGAGRNGDLTLSSTSGSKELRIGTTTQNIGFWMDGNVAANDTPAVLFANKTDTLSTAWSSANAVAYFGKYTSLNRSINAAGTINVNGGDYAEYFTQQTPGTLQQGDIVTLSTGGKAEKGNSSDQLLGVVSTQAGFVGNDIFDQNNPDATALVGLMGQIPTRVTTENGQIHVGDPLTTSATVPGAAMKATRAGMTIGKALEDYTNSDTTAVGKISVFVSATWNDPGLNTNQLGDLSTTVSQLQGQVTSLSSELANVSAQVPYLNQPNVFKGTSDKQFEIQNTQGTALLTADTKNMVVTVAALTVTGTLTVNGHIVTGGNTPTIAAGNAACTAPTVSINGNDESGMITVTTGTGCSLGGKLSAITFDKPYAAAPRVTITPTNSSSAALQTYVDNSTASPTSFDLNTTATSMIKPSTTYSWYYMVVQ